MRRFGLAAREQTRLSPGQSSITISFPKAEFGLSTENEWWGPGIRTAIVMSDNAEGYPRLFLGMPKPLDTSAGSFDVRWMGGLTESPWFDSDPTNNLRSISSIAGTWTPSFEPDLASGLPRSVFAPLYRVGAGILPCVRCLRVDWAAERPGCDGYCIQTRKGPDLLIVWSLGISRSRLRDLCRMGSRRNATLVPRFPGRS